MKPSSIILVLSVLFAVTASFAVGGYLGRKSVKSVPGKPDTVTVTKWIHDTVPEPIDSSLLKPKTVYLRKVERDTIPLHDTTIVVERVVDSVLVEVPIEEKTYEGENYRATVRGFQPELTDIWVKERETTVFVPSKKKWTITIGPQAGVGITPEGWRPYAGAGITLGYSFEINRNSR